MNDSPSTISPAWPTRWPKDSFTGFWTWALAAALALLFLVIFAFVLANGARVQNSVMTAANRLAFDIGLVAQALIEAALVAVVLAAMPALSKFSLPELGFRRPTAAVVGIAALGAVAMAIVANGLASLIDLLLHSQHQQDVVEIVKGLHDPGSLAIFCTYAVVLAPFFEESLFRVFFFNLGLRYGGFWAGAIPSALLFGIAHGDLYAAIPLALGGAILCYVYYRSRNAWASMISHALFNALSVLALLFAPNLVSS